VADVRLDRRERDHQLLGDLAVGEAAAHELEHLELAGREVLQEVGLLEAGRRALDVVGDEPLQHRGRHERLAAGDRLDRLDQPRAVDVLEQEAARAGPQRLVDVLVEVEGGEHEDRLGSRRARSGASPRCRPCSACGRPSARRRA
jgi:hypothetical protein